MDLMEIPMESLIYLKLTLRLLNMFAMEQLEWRVLKEQLDQLV